MGQSPGHAARSLSAEALAALGARRTLVTYLELTDPPARALRAAPSVTLDVRQARRPTLSFYLYLYDTIGAPWTWVARLTLDDHTLTTLIQDPAVEIHVLWQDGVPAGFIELDARDPANVEIAYFGLIPEFAGQGLGTFLLDWAIGHVFSPGPTRLWVHTCDLDHPAALALYQRAGFRIFDRRLEPVLPPATA